MVRTDHPYAAKWRAECRARLAKVLPKAGRIVVLRTPMRFADDTLQDRFWIVEMTTRRRKKLLFVGSNSTYYQLPNLRHLDYTIECPHTGEPLPPVT